MSLIVADEGLVRFLNLLTGGVGMGAVRIRLYTNNYTPIHASAYASFTEATFPGYAQVTPTYGSATLAGDVATTEDTSPRDFTHSASAGSETIYGYYVVDTTTSKLLFAEKFTTSQVMANDGDKITLTSLFTLTSEF